MEEGCAWVICKHCHFPLWNRAPVTLDIPEEVLEIKAINKDTTEGLCLFMQSARHIVYTLYLLEG